MDEVIKKIESFVEKRKWEKYHTPKNLAISIAIESAELLEHFQWEEISFDDIKKDEFKIKEIEEEIADVIIYSILFFTYLGTDIKMALLKKIKKNEEKYPA